MRSSFAKLILSGLFFAGLPLTNDVGSRAGIRSAVEPQASEVSSPAFDAVWNAQCLVKAIIQVESNGDPRKIGRHGERGLMQIKAETWRDMTIRLFGRPLPFDQAFDPALNRRVGTAYLAWLQEALLTHQERWKADERALLLAAYNAGPGRVRAAGFCLRHLPAQTRDYVERASALHDFYLNTQARVSPVRSSNGSDI